MTEGQGKRKVFNTMATKKQEEKGRGGERDKPFQLRCQVIHPSDKGLSLSSTFSCKYPLMSIAPLMIHHLQKTRDLVGRIS